MLSLVISIVIIAIIASLILWAPRAKLNADIPASRVPKGLSLSALKDWLDEREAAVPELTPGAEAAISWADPKNSQRTRLCCLYLHGFSATPQETKPVTEQIASHLGANTMHARLDGHGVKPGMMATAEDWLQSVVDAWDIAQQIGEKVIIVATSTGAPLSVWLASQHVAEDRIHAVLFMSPNFKVRSSIAGLLTWPWSHRWIHHVAGKHYEWEPKNERERLFWTTRYPIHALIEMQKTVDWVRGIDVSRFNIPLATMYMQNDPTIDPTAAVLTHEAWGASYKQLIPVTLDGDQVEHVFVGDITAPHRVDWCVERFILFMSHIPEA